MNAARHKIINFPETFKIFIYLLENISDTIWYFFFLKKSLEIIPKVFEELMGRYSIFNVKKYIKISKKIIAIWHILTSFLLDIILIESIFLD